MEKKSMIDIAYDYVENQHREIAFAEIWNFVVKSLSLSEAQANDKVAKFYTNLMLDGRFVDLGNNIWDLRSNHTFDKIRVDLNDVYSDVEEEIDEVDDEEILEELKIKSKEDSKSDDDEEEEVEKDFNAEESF